jgi:hypothetical protein
MRAGPVKGVVHPLGGGMLARPEGRTRSGCRVVRDAFAVPGMWSCGEDSHPPIRHRRAACDMTGFRGPGCSFRSSSAALPSHGYMRAHPGSVSLPADMSGRRSWPSRCPLTVFRLVQQVPGAGEEFAGDRRGGDLLAPAVRDPLVAVGELRGPLGGLSDLVAAGCGAGRTRRCCTESMTPASARSRAWSSTPLTWGLEMGANSRSGTPFFVSMWLPSITARDQSISFAAFSWASRIRYRSSNTPALIHRLIRRQHVMPDLKPSSCGRSSQPIPVCSTYKMPCRHCRSGTGRGPGAFIGPRRKQRREKLPQLIIYQSA